MSNGTHNGYLGVEVSIAGPLLVITESMNKAREELINLLIDAPRQFEDHKRMLSEYQAHMRAADVLAGHVDVKGNALNRSNGLLIDDTTVQDASAIMKNPPNSTEKTLLSAVEEAISERAIPGAAIIASTNGAHLEPLVK
jgi:hypothetical protein